MRIKSVQLLILQLISWTSVLSPIHALEKRTYMVPMRDSVRLAMDVYTPAGQGSGPIILVRSPYGRDLDADDTLLNTVFTLFTETLEYGIAIQDNRGRYDSEGVDSLFFSDGWGRVQDGYDTIEWIAQQEWSNGKIGMFGPSALGISQYLAAGAAPPHLTCCLAMVAASNLYEDAVFYGGAYRRSLMDGWVREQDAEHLLDLFVQHPTNDGFYDIVNLAVRWDSVNVPILHIGGWYDIFIQGQINAFTNIQERGGPHAAGNQYLIVGPWKHSLLSSSIGELVFANSSILQFLPFVIEWYNHWLKGNETDIPQMSRVQYYLMGNSFGIPGAGNRWCETDTWPPVSEITPFYLHQNGRLDMNAPAAFEVPDEFDYDPDDPVPTIGGRNLNLRAGPYDQRSAESRTDVIVYTSEPLAEPLTVIGRVTVRLYASSYALDTDFTAKLCDVYPDGRSMLIADGILQTRHRNGSVEEEFLMPGEITEFNLDLWSTAAVFEKWHRMRLSISSSNFPRFEANPNTGEPFRQNTRTQIAHQTIYHDADHASALLLPVVEEAASDIASSGSPIPENPILGQNYPNPFNTETFIPLNLSSWRGRERIVVEIIDTCGRSIKVWRLTPQQDAVFPIRWNGRDTDDSPVASGIYICRVTDDAHAQAIKMTLIR